MKKENDMNRNIDHFNSTFQSAVLLCGSNEKEEFQNHFQSYPFGSSEI